VRFGSSHDHPTVLGEIHVKVHKFSGTWNGYEPYEYPKAFQKIVGMFRDAGADNVAFVWCYEPAAPAEVDEVDAEGNPKWFPGDDVIDWSSLEVFYSTDFSGGGAVHDRANAFLEMALEHEKPVVVAESSARDLHISDDSAAVAKGLPHSTPPGDFALAMQNQHIRGRIFKLHPLVLVLLLSGPFEFTHM
jgi:hypothetical protein